MIHPYRDRLFIEAFELTLEYKLFQLAGLILGQYESRDCRLHHLMFGESYER